MLLNNAMNPAARSVPCPTCRAEKDKGCTYTNPAYGPHGTPIMGGMSHLVRVTAWMDTPPKRPSTDAVEAVRELSALVDGTGQP